MVDTPDTFTEDGAIRLANQIRRYWRKRGHSVSVWVDKIEGASASLRSISFQVRSNLVNGMPK